MSKQIFVNLPVKDLNRSIDFFSNLGFSFNPLFTDESSTCMIISDNIFAMLLDENFFKSFINKVVSDPKLSSEVIITITEESREAVDLFMQKVTQAGGFETREAMDHEWMYSRSFEDPDGHIWEVIYMDESMIAEPSYAIDEVVGKDI